MGYSDSSDQFLLHTDPLVRGIPRVEKSVDDILGQCTGFQHLAQCLDEVLTRAIGAGYKFSLKKFRILNNLKFGGFNLDADRTGDVTVSPDPERLAALFAMEEPSSKKEVQSFLGLLNVL